MNQLSTEIWVRRESYTTHSAIVPIQHVDDALTFPISSTLDNSSNWTYHRAQKDIDTLCPCLESHVPGPIVCQFLVPTCGDMYTTRKCAHVVGSADTVSGIVQT